VPKSFSAKNKNIHVSGNASAGPGPNTLRRRDVVAARLAATPVTPEGGRAPSPVFRPKRPATVPANNQQIRAVQANINDLFDRKHEIQAAINKQFERKADLMEGGSHSHAERAKEGGSSSYSPNSSFFLR
jgi:hypothetical protein